MKNESITTKLTKCGCMSVIFKQKFTDETVSSNKTLSVDLSVRLFECKLTDETLTYNYR